MTDKLYDVVYDTPKGERVYCVNASLPVAQRLLAKFNRVYMNEDGTPKQYPNGRGYYSYTNPRIIEAPDELC
jgi:hypothetical protein